MKHLLSLLVTTTVASTTTLPAAPPQFKFEARDIDQIEIGYGLQIEDVDGDGKVDILLADKSTVQWYQNPAWQKHVIAKDLTPRDNVCLTARDTDGDGRCEIAVGAMWNPGETTDASKSGAVFYLQPPANRAEPWKPVALPHEPTVHRMHWIKGANGVRSFVVKPLHGRGNKGGKGAGGLILEYHRPKSPAGEWKTEVVSDFMHATHNFHPVNWDADPEEELLVAGAEGVWYFDKVGGKWTHRQLTTNPAGEIRDGKLPGGRRFIATIEPMHGVVGAVYAEPKGGAGRWERLKALDEKVKEGHGLAVADLLGLGSDQVVLGWRGMNPKGIPGIKIFTPADPDGAQWHEQQISDKEVAVEDLKVADLNGDGKPEIIAAARQTKNLRIFWNRR